MEKAIEEFQAGKRAGTRWGAQTAEGLERRKQLVEALWTTVPNRAGAVKKEKEQATLDNLPRLLVISANNRVFVRHWFRHWFPVLVVRISKVC